MFFDPTLIYTFVGALNQGNRDYAVATAKFILSQADIANSAELPNDDYNDEELANLLLELVRRVETGPADPVFSVLVPKIAGLLIDYIQSGEDENGKTGSESGESGSEETTSGS
jgi:hypothetical protein